MAKKDKEANGQESSADDIIEQLAQEMGVDDEGDEGQSDGDELDEGADDAAGEVDEVVDEEPAAAHGYSHEDLSVANSPPMTNDEAIDAVFGPSGNETRLGQLPELEDELDRPKSRGPQYLVGVLVLGIGAVAGVYFGVLSDVERECLNIELSGRSCVEYHEAIEDARLEQERIDRLATAPKFGTVVVTTEPQALRVSAEGHPAYVMPGTRTDLMVPSRTRLTFQDISVTAPFTFTIHGDGNLEDRVVTIPPFDDPSSPWAQDQFSGDYAASLMYTICWPGSPDVGADHCLNPVPERAREFEWRLNWQPPIDTAAEGEEVQTRLLGSITVTSNPPGARIAYNGRPLWNEETENGDFYVTPHTFSTFNAPTDREDRTPSEVYLSREGMPITVIADGKLPSTDGVYIHQFLCEPREGAVMPPEPDPSQPDAPAADWSAYCNYTYAINLELFDPPPPAEGSGEGSGAPAAQ